MTLAAHLRVPLSALAALLACAYAAAGEPAAAPLCAVRIAAPPPIDGQLDEPSWARLPAAAGFAELGSAGTRRAFRQTSLRACYDADALYLGVVCLEPDPASIVAKVAERDGAVWLEDAVELFLQPDLGSARYFHFIVNANGVYYDALVQDAGWDADIKVKAARFDTHWQLELAIPWRALGQSCPVEGARWGFNVAREHRPPGAPEWSTWMPLQEGRQTFGVPERFGRLRFVSSADAGAVSFLREPGGLVENPDFCALDQAGKPRGWRVLPGTACAEVARLSADYAISNASNYFIAGQRIDVPVKPGDSFTAFAVAKADGGAQIGMAVRREETDGKRWDIYPFWKMKTEGSYTLYAQAIVVPAKTTRLVEVNLYRANKQGRVWFDYVQVLPGIHGQAMLTDLTRHFRPDAHPIGEAAPSPHLPLARPLAGGRVRALCFATRQLREVHELAQRLDMDYDWVQCPRARKAKGRCLSAYAYNPKDIILSLSGGNPYDVIILAAILPSSRLMDKVLAAVANGAGLVVVQPIAGHRPADAASWAKFKAALPAVRPIKGVDHWIVRGSSQSRLRALGAGTHGKGRVVVLDMHDPVGGLIPTKPGRCRWWEYRYALLARAAIWAARRQPAAQITSVAPVAGHLNVHVDNPQGLALELACVWDHEKQPDQDPFARAQVQDIGSARDQTCRIAQPNLPTQGVHLGTVVLRDSSGATLDWSTASIEVRASLRLGEIQLPKDVVSPGEPIDASVQVLVQERQPPAQAGRDEQAQLVAKLVDAFGRVVDSHAQAVPLSAGDSTYRTRLTVRRPLAVYHRLVVDLAGSGGLFDRAWADVFVPTARADALDDFQLAAGYTAIPFSPPGYLQGAAVGFMRSNGFSCIMPDSAGVRHGMVGFRSSATKAGARHSGSSHVRPACFSNPAHVKKVVDATVSFVAAHRKWGFIGYTMWDEVHLSQTETTEVCFCDHCKRAFPDWLRRHYATLADLNGAWGTTLGTWEEAAPILRADAATRATQRPIPNLAQWVDFRRFMEHSWLSIIGRVQAALKPRWPEAKLSFTNPYRFGPLSGSNAWLMTRSEDLLLKYFKPANTPRYRSYTAAPMVSWFGYRSTADDCRRYLWWFALNGGAMPIWWDPLEPWDYGGKRGLVPWQCFDPLWRHTARSQAVAESARDLREGFGKLLRTARRAQAQVAILHSQESMHLAYALDATRPKGQACLYKGWQQSDASWRALLDQNGVAYDYVAADDLRADQPGLRWDAPHRKPTGTSALDGYRVLILPYTLALSDASATIVADFAASGGHVVADALPAICDEHGTPRPPANTVAKLFGIEFRALPVPRRTDASVSFDDLKLAAMTGDAAPGQVQHMRPAGARAAASTTDGARLLFERTHGRGRALCLGFVPASSAQAAALVAELLAAAQVRVPYAVTAEPHDAALDVETYVYELGQTRYVALVRSATADAETATYRVSWAKPAHTYDSRHARYLGHVSQVTLPIARAGTAFMSLLPYRVESVRTQATPAPAGEPIRVKVEVQALAPRLEDHVLHVRLCAPDGAQPHHYRWNVAASAGKVELQLPTAYNDAPGTWTVRVKDVASGVAGQTRVQLSPPRAKAR